MALRLEANQEPIEGRQLDLPPLFYNQPSYTVGHKDLTMKNFLALLLASLLLVIGTHVGLLKEEVHEAGGISSWTLDSDGLHCIEQLSQQPCTLFAREYFMYEGQ